MKVQDSSAAKNVQQLLQARQSQVVQGAGRSGGDSDGDNDGGRESASKARSEAGAKGNSVNVTA